MIHAKWTPGESLAAITQNGAVIVKGEARDELDGFHQDLLAGASFGDALRRLNANANSLADLPDFALVVPDDECVHVAVRGVFSVASGDHRVDGTVAVSWIESRFPLGAELAVGLVGESGFSTSGGVVPASGFEIVFPEPVAPAAVADGEVIGSCPTGLEDEQFVDDETVSVEISDDEAPTEPAAEEAAPAEDAVSAEEGAPGEDSADAESYEDLLEDVPAEELAADAIVVADEPLAEEAEAESVEADAEAAAEAPEAAESEQSEASAPGPEAAPEVDPFGLTLQPEDIDRLKVEAEAQADADRAAESDEAGLNDEPDGDALPADFGVVNAANDPYSDLSPEASHFADLWGETVVRSVEDAALRDLSDEDDGLPGAAAAKAPAPSAKHLSAPADEPDSVDDAAPADDSPAEDTSADAPAASDSSVPTLSFEAFLAEMGGATAAPAAAAETAAPATSGLIDSVPGISRSAATPAPVPSPAAPWIPKDPAPEPEKTFEAKAAEVLGDHDGETVTAVRAQQLRAGAGNVGPDADLANKTLSVRCFKGHPNPPHAVACRECGGGVGNETEWLDRPVLGTLVSSSGVRVPLDADVIVGRKPNSVPEPGRPRPHLVTVPSPDQQISRTHVEIRVDGWDMRVIDRNSNNGTFLIREGEAPVRVSTSMPMILQGGDVIDIGEDVLLTVEAK